MRSREARVPTEFDSSLVAYAQTAEHRSDGWWLEVESDHIPAVAALMMDRGFRLSTVSGRLMEDDRIELIYHYANASIAYNIRTRTRNGSMPSIATVSEAADWIEREIHDLFAVDFTGHPELARLIRPPELAPGFFGEATAARRKTCSRSATPPRR